MQALHTPNTGTTYPLVTIAIPTRNRASLARESVVRALAQSYSNIEVLVSDNASTDDTLATLRSISDPRLRILTNPENIGHIGNYNKCVREASGDYLLIVPDDDRISDSFVEKCVDLLRGKPDVQAVVGAYDVFLADENRKCPAVLSKRLSTGIWDGSEILKELLGSQFPAAMLTTVVRTELLRQNGGFSSEHVAAADMATWGRVVLAGRTGLVNEACATLTLHSSSESTRLGLDCCFRDISKVVTELSEVAVRTIPDEASRRELQKLTARYVAQKFFECLVIYRRQGTALSEVASQLRIWAMQSRQCTLFDFMATLRLKTLALLLLPPRVVRWLIGLRGRFETR